MMTMSSVRLSVYRHSRNQLPVSLRATRAARAKQLLATRRVRDADLSVCGR